MKTRVKNLMKKPDESSILWMLYQWQGEWGSYKKLAHFTRIPIDKCRSILRLLATEGIVFLAPTVRELSDEQIQTGEGYFLNPVVRDMLDNYDSE
jgi:hypothetical protein